MSGPIDSDSAESTPVINDEQRRELFAQLNARRSVRGRSGTFVPPKFVLGVTAAFVVLGGGGAVLEHYYGGVGVVPETTTTFALTPTPTSPTGKTIVASLQSLLGLRYIQNAEAPPVSLTDQHDQHWTLRSQRGHNVVITFFNSACNDICPIEANEIRQADQLLGPKASTVTFAVVNSDPQQTALTSDPNALSSTGLSSLSNVVFLTGNLHALNAIWSNYGETIRVGAQANQLSHNNIMYFVSQSGALVAQAVPFGNESTAGVFHLDAPTMHLFAKGIVNVLGTLAS